MRKHGIDEWLVQSMFMDVRSRVRVGDGYSEEFGVGVGVHQGSVLSPLLFIIVLEALSREFRTGCPWELLYADELLNSAESMKELLVKLNTLKSEMEKKGPRVNMGKTKTVVSGMNLDLLQKSGNDPCGFTTFPGCFILVLLFTITFNYMNRIVKKKKKMFYQMYLHRLCFAAYCDSFIHLNPPLPRPSIFQIPVSLYGWTTKYYVFVNCLREDNLGTLQVKKRLRHDPFVEYKIWSSYWS